MLRSLVTDRRAFVCLALFGIPIVGLSRGVVFSEEKKGKDIIITAADLAPSSMRSDEPMPGKWWLRRGVEGAPGGAMLLTGKVEEKPIPKDKLVGEWKVMPVELFATPYRVPALEVDPK